MNYEEIINQIEIAQQCDIGEFGITNLINTVDAEWDEGLKGIYLFKLFKIPTLNDAHMEKLIEISQSICGLFSRHSLLLNILQTPKFTEDRMRIKKLINIVSNDYDDQGTFSLIESFLKIPSLKPEDIINLIDVVNNKISTHKTIDFTSGRMLRIDGDEAKMQILKPIIFHPNFEQEAFNKMSTTFSNQPALQETIEYMLEKNNQLFKSYVKYYYQIAPLVNQNKFPQDVAYLITSYLKSFSSKFIMDNQVLDQREAVNKIVDEHCKNKGPKI